MDPILRMESMRNMIDSDGWKILEKHIDERMEDMKTKLLAAKDFEAVRTIQTQYRTYEDMFGTIRTWIEEGEEAVREQNRGG